MTERIAYARVSTVEQNLETQINALRSANAGIVYAESVSGAKAARPELEKALAALRPGNEFLVTHLDRLGRSIKNLLEVVERIEQAGATLVVLDQAIDTKTPIGRFFLHTLASVAEFEKELISLRTRESLVGRARGRNGGRPKTSNRVISRAQDLYDSKTMTLVEIAAAVGVSKATLCRHLTLDTRSNAATGIAAGG